MGGGGLLYLGGVSTLYKGPRTPEGLTDTPGGAGGDKIALTPYFTIVMVQDYSRIKYKQGITEPPEEQNTCIEGRKGKHNGSEGK